MFLYYLINIWKTKQSWLKKTLSHLAGLAHLRVFIWKIFISPWWDVGQIKWDLTLASWVASHMNALYFYKSFFNEGEISPRRANPPNRAISPPYKQPLNGKCLRLIYNDKHSTCHELLKKHCSFLFILKTCNFLTWKCINKLKVSL